MNCNHGEIKQALIDGYMRQESIINCIDIPCDLNVVVLRFYDCCDECYNRINRSMHIRELEALGFEKYWIEQAMELTNNDQEKSLECLLSDEFALAKENFNRPWTPFYCEQ